MLARASENPLIRFCIASLVLSLGSGAVCAQAHDPKLVEYVDAAFDIMEQHSVYRNVIYWQDFREILFERTEILTELSDAHALIAEMLLEITDTHGGIYPPDYVDAMQNDGVASSRLPAWTPVTARLIDKRVGYITVPGIIGLSEERKSQYVDEMHDMIKSIDSKEVCAWVVDLRGNMGGNVLPMLTGIAPILGTGEAGGGIRPDRGTYTRRVENPYFRLKNRYPPVAVLIGRETASSGETTAVAFIGREMSTTIGEPTAGLTTGLRPFFLEDGSALVLSTNLITDRIGRSYLGSIQPHIKATSDEIIDVAVEWLRRFHGC